MVKLCQKVFATGITTADNVATVIVPVNCTLVSIAWNWYGYNAGAIGSIVLAQLSTMGTSSWTSNDVRGLIDETACGGDKAINFGFNGNKVLQIAGLKFNAGDVIRFHRLAATAPTSINISANLFFV